MTNRGPKKNFETFWNTFHRRYPFFELRKVDWKKQYDTYRPKVTKETGDEELFDILCRMIDPLDDGHIELEARIGGKKRRFTTEKKTRFQREFTEQEIKQLFKTSEKTLVANGFGRLKLTEVGILRYGRSKSFGCLRIVELEGNNKRKLTAPWTELPATLTALRASSSTYATARAEKTALRDSATANGSLSTDGRRSVRARTILPPLQTRYLAPQGDIQFTGPIVL